MADTSKPSNLMSLLGGLGGGIGTAGSIFGLLGNMYGKKGPAEMPLMDMPPPTSSAGDLPQFAPTQAESPYELLARLWGKRSNNGTP